MPPDALTRPIRACTADSVVVYPGAAGPVSESTKPILILPSEPTAFCPPELPTPLLLDVFADPQAATAIMTTAPITALFKPLPRTSRPFR